MQALIEHFNLNISFQLDLFKIPHPVKLYNISFVCIPYFQNIPELSFCHRNICFLWDLLDPTSVILGCQYTFAHVFFVMSEVLAQTVDDMSSFYSSIKLN